MYFLVPWLVAGAEKRRTTLRVGGLFPFRRGSSEQEFAHGVFKQVAGAALLAVDHFNERNGVVAPVLANLGECSLRIEMEVFDTRTEASWTMAAYRNAGTVDAFVGPALSSNCEPAATEATVDGTPVVSYSSTATSLSAKSAYPLIARTIPPDSLVAKRTVELAAEIGFHRIAVLYTSSSYGEGWASVVTSECPGLRLECRTASFESGDGNSIQRGLDALRDYTIFLVIMIDDDFERVLRQATEANMTGAHTAWYTADGVTEEAVLSLDLELGKIANGIGRVIATGAVDGARGTRALRETFDARDARTFQMPVMFEEDTNLTYDQAHYAYDAVVALGKAACDANETIFLASSKSSSSLEWLSSYEDAWMTSSSLMRAIVGTEFEGASGSVSFSASTADRETANILLQNFVLDDRGKLEKHDILLYRNGAWESLSDRPFIYNSGSATPPEDALPWPVVCGPGYYADEFQCRACPAGKYKPDWSNGTSNCIPCDSYSFSETAGSAECRACGKNAHSVDGSGSSSRYDCYCEQGSYSRVWPIDPDKGCESCRHLEAHCRGGSCQPSPKKNNWLSPTTTKDLYTYRCRQGFFCPGSRKPGHAARGFERVTYDDDDDARNGSSTRFGGGFCHNSKGETEDLRSPNKWCLAGRDVQIPLCDGTKTTGRKRYFSVSNLSARCPEFVSYRLFTIFCWLLLAALFVTMNEIIRPRYQVLNIILDVYQDLGVISTFHYYWPAPLEVTFVAYSIALLDVDTYEPTCAIRDWGFPHAFWVMLSLPIIHAAFRISYTALSSPRNLDAWRRTTGSVLSYLFGSYPSLITRCLSAFTCWHIRGVGLLQEENLEQRCHAPSNQVRRVVAACYLAVVVIAVPVVIFAHLNVLRRKNLLCSRQTLDKYGFLYNSFHSNALHWGVVRLAKQAALCAIATTLWASPAIQMLASVCVLAYVASEQSQTSPNLAVVCNDFELYGLLLVVVSSCLGFIFTYVETSNSHQHGLFIIIFFGVQGAYLAAGLYVTYDETRAVAARDEAKRVISDAIAAAAAAAARTRSDDEESWVSIILGTSGSADLEILETFKGEWLKTWVQGQTFRADPHRAISEFQALDAVLAPFVADDSLTNNFSNSYEADFYRHLDQHIPALLDLLVSCSDDVRLELRDAVTAVARSRYFRHLSGFSFAHCIEKIDRSSVLVFLMHVSRGIQRAKFADFIKTLVDSNPSHAKQRSNAAALRLALALQRAWRLRRGIHKMLHPRHHHHQVSVSRFF
ncbi:hypothetical protein CTAYLR_002616 [Chrysophaeum taylorii]|uniref:Receptor ligand binding region domain-containing protein n=1 Tax=Chrysophaeum taylorii TaxID=2483200 RepID=A0AAD7UD12_9STRA|nr:hypothetical protein CTAYLR_002616 [Chrysophaeum taylorii]